jgi:benzoyl-CoA reductase/2-hydroxyglutaryl-CoA dehydratase subunit BcrC/BadD/HgdB
LNQQRKASLKEWQGKKMGNERAEAAQRTTRLHLAMEATETLRKVEEFSGNPSAMGYFYNFFRDLFTGESILPEEKQLIGTLCVQVPDELIYATGAMPFRLCSGAYAYDQIGADFMPAKSCPVVRATSGMLHINQNSWRDTLTSLIIPTTCDQKRKATEQISDLSYNVYSLEMPSSKESDAAKYYWQESVKQFALYLEKITGKKITRKNLKKAILKKSKAAQLYRRLYELRKSDSPVMFGKDMLLVTNGFFMDDIDNWMKAVKILLRELEERDSKKFSVSNRNAPRILLTGSPPVFPNIKVPILVEQSGAVIVADEVCSSSRLLYDAVAYDEERLDDMIPAIADRYLKPCTCPCLTPNMDRKRKIVEMVHGFNIDGVIYQAFSGCLPYEMEQNQIAKVLEEINIPMLYVETDYSPEDHGQLSTRVEAFIESIKMRKRKRKGRNVPSFGKA